MNQSSALLLYMRGQSDEGEGAFIYERNRSSRVVEADKPYLVHNNLLHSELLQHLYATFIHRPLTM